MLNEIWLKSTRPISALLEHIAQEFRSDFAYLYRVEQRAGSANVALTRPSIGMAALWSRHGKPGSPRLHHHQLLPASAEPSLRQRLPPAHFQGTRISDLGYLPNIEAAAPESLERKQLDFIRDYESTPGAPDPVEGVIQSYELAFRMQGKVPDLLDISKEPQHVLDAYGGKPGPEGSYARQCLMARRLSEAGVRFVEICQGGWDHHTNLHAGLIEPCRATDQATSALLTDLRQRGLLDDTLGLVGSEFGPCPCPRAPMAATTTSPPIPCSSPGPE
jgi:hypothetical protein